MALSKNAKAEAEGYFKQGLAHHYNDKDHDKEAILEFQKSIAISPSYSDAYYWMGQAYYFNKQYENAIDAWKQYLTLKPDFVSETDDDIGSDNAPIYTDDVYSFMGRAYEKLDRYAEAIATYEECLALDPEGWAAESSLERITKLPKSKWAESQTFKPATEPKPAGHGAEKKD